VTGADQRPTPHEKKTGARYRKITALCEKKKGKRRKFFSQETSVLLDLPANGCLLMGDHVIFPSRNVEVGFQALTLNIERFERFERSAD